MIAIGVIIAVLLRTTYLLVNKEKLVISTTITPDKIPYVRVGPEVFVYSGLYATADDLDKLEAELNSPELLEYLIENGKPMRTLPLPPPSPGSRRARRRRPGRLRAALGACPRRPAPR